VNCLVGNGARTVLPEIAHELSCQKCCTNCPVRNGARTVCCYLLCTQPNTLRSNHTKKISYWYIRKSKKLELHMQWSTDWIQCSIYSKHSTHFYAALLAAVAYISKPELLQDCWWCWFSELKWDRSLRSKATWTKSFLMLLDYCKKIIQSQR